MYWYRATPIRPLSLWPILLCSSSMNSTIDKISAASENPSIYVFFFWFLNIFNSSGVHICTPLELKIFENQKKNNSPLQLGWLINICQREVWRPIPPCQSSSFSSFYAQTKAAWIHRNCPLYKLGNWDIHNSTAILVVSVERYKPPTHLLHLVIHLLVWLNLPPSGHVPGGVDPVPHLRLRLAVNNLNTFHHSNGDFVGSC